MVKKLSLFSLLLLIVPCATWISHWKFSGIENLKPALDLPLFYLTQTSTFPFSIITCVVFTLILMALKRKSFLLIGILCLISVLGTQGIKAGLKDFFAEPRPYVEYLFEDSSAFYALKKSERREKIREIYKDSPNQFAANHHAHELGYAFPSGHSIFAASWLLIFAGVLYQSTSLLARFSQLALAIWALLMLLSRLRLGMHYPIDLFASVVIAWIFHIILFSLAPALHSWANLHLIARFARRHGQ